MKVLHSSDLHGRYKKLLAVDEPFDLWVDTGDFFPNKGRVPATGYAIVPWLERSHQSRWWRWKSLGRRLASWLNHRPMLSVAGNHDFVSLAVLLQASGVAARAVSPEGVEMAGIRWSGFRQIPWMEGEWPGETHDFRALVADALATRPEVLLTHAPPSEVLDDGEGVPGLLDALQAAPSTVRAHLFGHVHHHGGEEAERHGIRFVNGAEHVRILTLPD